MNTQTDRNFKSYDGPQENISNVVLDPIGAGWAPNSWQDTCKFWHRVGCLFDNFTIVDGGTEDGVDMSSRNVMNAFGNFKVAAGAKYVLTLKGSSSHNNLLKWIITKPGKWVDVQIGNWSDDDPKAIKEGFSKWARSEGNFFSSWTRIDGQPIRYAYRYGCKPSWYGTNTKHLWWMSVGITVYWYAKYLLVKLFGGAK